MMTNEQVDEIENKLRQAQNLIEECGAVWNLLTSMANDVGDTICSLWRLRPEE